MEEDATSIGVEAIVDLGGSIAIVGEINSRISSI